MDSPRADFGANERSAREQWVARCRVTLTGHTGPVRYVAWAAMGGRPRIATAGDDGTARVWDPADGREVTRLEGHSSPVWHLAWGELDGQPVLATAAGVARRGCGIRRAAGSFSSVITTAAAVCGV